MFDKDKFRQDLLDAIEPRATCTTPRINPFLVVFAVFFVMLLGWVTADIWAAVHHIA